MGNVCSAASVALAMGGILYVMFHERLEEIQGYTEPPVFFGPSQTSTAAIDNVNKSYIPPSQP